MMCFLIGYVPYFLPPSASPAPGRAEAGAVCTHPKLQVAGCSSGGNRGGGGGGGDACTEPTGGEESQKQAHHNNIPNQVMSSAAASNLSDKRDQIPK